MKVNCRYAPGFTLVEVMIVVAIIGLLMAVGIPNLARARMQSQKNLCISHLREIDSIKQQWALEHRKTEQSEPPTEEDLRPYFWREIWPSCPAGGTYEPNGVGVAPTCSLGPSLGHVLED
ncbi:MAG: prepilin-type N-terminal cleavage/methylation domain-containing protein [Verrucomicrobiota bacterium]|nr:prepilin-type N-terminal cleavage/methylation domain-containing protein [Limisphaera sp.]MDW8381312.1 prepilin-type N-terminal cleavage/methylation domain-containing protein [Verrucomicrobiota bacterium]